MPLELRTIETEKRVASLPTSRSCYHRADTGLAHLWCLLDFRDNGLLDHRQRVRVEFKSKAVIHFHQRKAPIARASLADNGAIHTVAINALTVFDVVHAHPLLAQM